MPGPNDEKRPVSDVEKEEMKDRRRPVSVVANATLVGRVSVGLEKEEGAKGSPSKPVVLLENWKREEAD